MGTYNIHAGHAPSNSGGASGAVGILNESNEARKVKDQVIFSLQNQGHTVYDCTCNQGLTQNGVLKDIVSKCNYHAVDLDVSIHFNAGGGKGVEVWCYDSGTSKIAEQICDKISDLGFANRGVKYSKQLYVLSNTKSPAVLVECCFADSQTDANIYNTNKMAKAIVEGILGKNIDNAIVPKLQKVQSYSANYSDAQKWKIVKDFPGDFYQIFSKYNTNYLNVEGAQGIKGSNVTVAPGNRKSEQNWFVKEIKQDIGIGTTSVYELLPALNGNLRLTVDGPYAKDGTNVNIQEAHTDYRQDGQRFYIRQVADGYVNIINVATGKLLDVYNAGK